MPEDSRRGRRRFLAADLRAIAGVRRGALPQQAQPQLATSATAAPEGDGWLHEAKLDGYRLMARIAPGELRLFSRNGKDWTARFASLAAALALLPVRATLLDGEAVHLRADGHTSFSDLKDDLSIGRADRLFYYAFDLLHLDGYDMRAVRLDRRKTLLRRLFAQAPAPLRYSEHVIGEGARFHAQACAMALEGVVSKRRDAPYRAGRSETWRKVKCLAREELVIIGWTDPGGSRHGFGALLLGYFDRRGGLHFAGAVGTGFSDADLDALRRRLDHLKRTTAPSRAIAAAAPRRAHWIAPVLVAELRFTEWTKDGRLRHPVFLGLREDKGGSEIVRDPPSRAVT